MRIDAEAEPAAAQGSVAVNGNKVRPVIREASLEDYPQIAFLAQQYGLEIKSCEEWRHLWVNNPLYMALRKDWPIGWVLENPDRQIVGYLGNIPLLYEYCGRKITVASAHCWVTDTAYRSYSILLMDRYFGQKDVDLYLNSTVNAAGCKAFSIFQSLPVPVGAWNQSRFWITNYRGFTASLIAMKGPPWAAWLGYPLSVVLLLKDITAGRVLNGTLRSGSSEVKVEFCSEFDDRFDTFWVSLRERKSHLLLGVRTREMLEWHFHHALLKKRIWILTATGSSGLLAYAIFHRQDNPRFRLIRMRLVDFQTLDKSPSLLLPMLSFALKRCRREGIHMLECMGPLPQQREPFQALRACERRLPSWLYFYWARNHKLAEGLADPNAWYPSWFDGDASLQ